MNIMESIRSKIEQAERFPVIISNKDCPLIQESALIIQQLEDEGYMCVTFSDKDTYGIRVYDKIYEIVR